MIVVWPAIMRRVHWLGALGCLLTTACGGVRPRDAQPAAAEPRVAVVGMELGGKKLKPHVRGTLAGRPVIFLLDTGASSHALTLSAATSGGMAVEESNIAGSDHAGAAVTVRRVSRPDITVTGLGKLQLAGALVVEVPQFFDALGIAGFLNPQLLGTGDDEVVLDFTHATLSIGHHVASSPPPGTRSLGSVAACEQLDDKGIRSRVFILDGEVEGHPARLELDSGASVSDLFASSGAGGALATKHSVAGSATGAGGEFVVRSVESTHLRIGKVEYTGKVDLIPGAAGSKACPFDGVLGMDVLQNCVLRFSKTRMDAFCTSQ